MHYTKFPFKLFRAKSATILFSPQSRFLWKQLERIYVVWCTMDAIHVNLSLLPRFTTFIKGKMLTSVEIQFCGACRISPPEYIFFVFRQDYNIVYFYYYYDWITDSWHWHLRKVVRVCITVYRCWILLYGIAHITQISRWFVWNNKLLMWNDVVITHTHTQFSYYDVI